MIEIDGSYGEGGGQMLRLAVVLSSITGIPVKVYNIRKNREKPGLRNQHLHMLLTVRKICRGRLEGAHLSSSEIMFHPSKIVGGRYRIRIPTAASITLVYQTLIPILSFSDKPSNVFMEGGTDVPFSPTWDYFYNLYLPVVKEVFGVEVDALLHRRGFYPYGGGKAQLSVKPSNVTFSNFPPTKEDRKGGYAVICSLNEHIALREKSVIYKELGIEVAITTHKCFGVGNALTAWKGFVGGSSVGLKGKRAEDVAKEVVEPIKNSLGLDVDERLADQLLLYLSLTGGRYTTGVVTNHLLSSLYVIDRFAEDSFIKKVKLSREEKGVKIYA